MMPGPQPSPVRAVVVDDSRLMRQMIVTALQAEGRITVVGEAADTAQARTLIRELDPDVITLDVEMPGMNGIEFLKKIMEHRPMPVVMVSTLTAAGTDVSLAALHLGAVDAIQKPAGREDLPRFARALRDKVLARRSWNNVRLGKPVSLSMVACSSMVCSYCLRSVMSWQVSTTPSTPRTSGNATAVPTM
mgnify:CR=1 FL=1